jgi:hypothetical protein
MRTDFQADARAWMFAQLRAIGHIEPESAQTDHLARLYFNLLWRTIQPAPRSVRMSETLRRKLAGSSESVRIAVRAIADRSARGESLRLFQSKGVAEATRHDDLFNDWRIHHLHVGPLHEPRTLRRARSRTEPRKGYFIGRSDELLFVCVDDDALYMIDLLKHGSWADRVLFDTMYREWPHIVERHFARGIVGYDVTNKQRAAARKNGLNLLTTVGERAYFPPGGGSSTSRMSIRVVTAADYFLDGVTQIEARVREAESTLRHHIERAGFVVGELDLEFGLDTENGGRVVLRERNTNVRFGTEFRLTTSGHLDVDEELRERAA